MGGLLRCCRDQLQEAPFFNFAFQNIPVEALNALDFEPKSRLIFFSDL